MTIKQQGGIFGRNPTFNDLTVEGTFTTSGATETSGDLSLNDSKLNITANRPQIFLKEQDRANNNVRLECQNDNFNIAYVDDDNLNNVTRFFVEMNTGDAKIVSGNLIIGTSGKGIDFSATSGTGTSELFDDYEEGTWTPTLSAYAGTPTTQGSYVKIGRVVKAGFKVILDGTSDGSNFRISGLPFSFGSDGGSGYGDGAVISYIDSGTTDIRFLCVGTTDIMAYNSSGTILSYNTVGASTEVRGVVIYTAA